MSRIKWRDQYDEKADKAASDHCASVPVGESLTQQQFAKDADLNELVRIYGGIGRVPVTPLDPRKFGFVDMTGALDLRAILDIGREAVQHFESLPADLRARFHNRVDLLHDWVSDPRNTEECFKLGLLKRPEEGPGGSAEPPKAGSPSVTPPPGGGA